MLVKGRYSKRVCYRFVAWITESGFFPFIHGSRNKTVYTKAS